MKLHTTSTQQYQTITAYDDNAVEINGVRFTHSLLVSPETTPTAWPVRSWESLTPSDFDPIAAAQPDVVILGTGLHQHFIHSGLIAALIARHIGVECMSNDAACRTYNILMSEGRKVLLALIF